MDDLQQELDNKTEELCGVRSQLEKQVLDFSNMQHQMSLVNGKEDSLHRKLFERETEIKQLRNGLQDTKANLESQTQLAQLKAQEVAELTEDIQTLTRENRFVNQEYAKASHANEILKKQNNELTDRERKALQAQRALELEKEDILQNYREANLEIEQLQSSMQQCAQENRDFYVDK